MKLQYNETADQENKLRQKHIDARWVTHNGNSYCGYKDHVKADEHTKLITGYKVTPANVHDSEMIGSLIDKVLINRPRNPDEH